MIISLNTSLDLKIFSPSEPIGILIIFLGLIFTGMIFYIIYAVSTNKESLEDKKIINIPRGSPGLKILRSKAVFREIIINILFLKNFVEI